MKLLALAATLLAVNAAVAAVGFQALLPEKDKASYVAAGGQLNISCGYEEETAEKAQTLRIQIFRYRLKSTMVADKPDEWEIATLQASSGAADTVTVQALRFTNYTAVSRANTPAIQRILDVTIPISSQKDSAEYTCKVSNSAAPGSQAVSATLGPRAVIETGQVMWQQNGVKLGGNVLAVKEGDAINLQCAMTEGFPGDMAILTGATDAIAAKRFMQASVKRKMDATYGVEVTTVTYNSTSTFLATKAMDGVILSCSKTAKQIGKELKDTIELKIQVTGGALQIAGTGVSIAMLIVSKMVSL